MIRFNKQTTYLTGALLATTTLLTSSSALAKDIPTRWFEIEVIVFTRDIPDDSILETFPQQVEPIRYHRNRDLLTRYHYPDIKPLFNATSLCGAEQLDPLAKLPTVMPRVIDHPDYAVSEEQPLEINEFTPVDIRWAMDDFVDPDWFVYQPKQQDSGCSDDPWFNMPTLLSDDPYKDRTFDYHYAMYPRVIKAGEEYNDLRVHLMTNRNFRLRDIYRTLRRQPNIRPILHTAWRQPAGAKKRMRATRLYGGIDYSRDYDFQGQPLAKDPLLTSIEVDESENSVNRQNPDSISVVDNIERLLKMVNEGATINYQSQSIDQADKVVSSEDDPTEVREVDGLFKVYVDVFNYLHIDAEFNVRREVGQITRPLDVNIQSLLTSQTMDETKVTGLGLDRPVESSDDLGVDSTPKLLNNYHFKQTRRVITKELHYFDHPYMGMIVLVRRWGW
jgi:hypothetical protein